MNFTRQHIVEQCQTPYITLSDLFRISSKQLGIYKHLNSAPMQQICDTYVPFRIFFVVVLSSPGQLFLKRQPKQILY